RRQAWTSELDSATKARLREFTERFLSDKAISAAGDTALDDDSRVLIAMLCCRPVLRLDYGWLRGWHEVIIYPEAFRTHARQYDSGAGVISEREVHASGESWW